MELAVLSVTFIALLLSQWLSRRSVIAY